MTGTRADSSSSRGSTPAIFVVTGLPRSGTSLMMQMLIAGGMDAMVDTARPPDEDNPRGYFELDAVKRTRLDASWLNDAPGKAVKVIHLLLKDLPANYRYRVLVMRRPTREVIESQSRMLRRLGQTGAQLTDVQLVAAYDRQMTDVVAQLTEAPNMDWIQVDYAQLVATPKRSAAGIAAFVKQPLNVNAMAAAVKPTLYRNRAAD